MVVAISPSSLFHGFHQQCQCVGTVYRTQINSVQQEEPKEGPGFDRNSLELAHTFADTFYRKIKHFFALIYL